jgi:hypothetical protein
MLAGLAVEAWREMQWVHQQHVADGRYAEYHDRSACRGGKIFLSSSIRDNFAGMQALRPCSQLSQTMYGLSTDRALSFPVLSTPARQQTGAVHLTGGNCGECSAIHAYLNRRRRHGLGRPRRES